MLGFFVGEAKAAERAKATLAGKGREQRLTPWVHALLTFPPSTPGGVLLTGLWFFNQRRLRSAD